MPSLSDQEKNYLQIELKTVVAAFKKLDRIRHRAK